MQINHLGQENRHSHGRDADGYVYSQRTAIGFVDDIQSSKDATAVERVAHEIERPYRVYARLDQQRLPFALRHPSLGSARQVETQLAVHAPNALVIPAVALSTQSIAALPEAPALLLRHDGLQCGDHRGVPCGSIDPRSVIRRPR